MPRESKVEREAREAVDRYNEWTLFCDSYPTRFASLMFAYFEHAHAGFRVVKCDSETYTFGRHAYGFVDLSVTPPANHNYDTMYVMGRAEAALQEYELEVAEENRKYQAKSAALAKLTKEEKELLGL